MLSVGRRVFVNCPNDPRGGVALTDDDGRSLSRRLADGVEVEIVAWRPRGGAGTRYRVRSTADHADGWLGANDLRSALHPVSVAPVEPAPVAERPVARDADTGRKFGQRR